VRDGRDEKSPGIGVGRYRFGLREE